MKRWKAAIGLVLCGGGVSLGQSGVERVPLRDVTLEMVMADPEWIARSPERPYWTDDGTGIYYTRKREGSEARDLWRVDVRMVIDGEGARYEAEEPRLLSEAERATADVRGGDLSEDRQWKVFSRDGDLFLKNIESGVTRALTKTAAGEFGARFLPGDRLPRRIMFQRDGAVLVRDLESGLEEQLVELRFEKEPEEKKKDEKKEFLAEQQERLFEFVRKAREQREEAEKREKEQKEIREAAAPPVVYMGDDVELREASASPTGEWMLVRVAKKGGKDGRRDTMPAFVTEDGYVKAMPVRTKVGTGERRGEELYLVDLRPGQEERRWKLDLAVLPGIADEPLRTIREAYEAKKRSATAEDAERMTGDESGKEEKKTAQPKPRSVMVREISWSEEGSRAVVQVFSLDNKDRWIAAVDFDEHALEPLERMSDEAWINGRFAQLGWLKDNRTIWYLSEETGYSQLFLLDLAARFSGEGGKLRFTGSEMNGAYEVSDVELSRDGSRFFFTANMERPGVHELYTQSLEGAKTYAEQLTHLGGQNDAVISPDERGVVVVHSDLTTPPELYVQPMEASPAKGNVVVTRLTRTVTEAYKAIEWMTPEVIGVPGRDGREIWSRLFVKGEVTEAGRHQGIEAKRPIVVFVHGAGYLQDAHEGWSNYFREHMFHNLLAERGYVVIAPDFRASAGYGRDWRTAIYRRMGEPELEDVEDWIAWLAKERGADPARVGIYGGSYGGFLSLMAMFTRPDAFVCGAALRPVTDWAHYNDGYTANILNTPESDPEAYEKSSPIEYAAGLRGRLLICHGMLDDNVFFQDTVRLAQRLIELKKENWEVAMYPIEAHGFKEATSWLDEYRRIDRLFRECLERGSIEAGSNGSP